MSFVLIVWFTMNLVYFDISVADTSEMSILKNKIIHFEKIMNQHEKRISYLEAKVMLQNAEIHNCNTEVNRLRPKVEAVELTLKSLKNIIRRKQNGKYKTMFNSATKEDGKSNGMQGIVRRNVNIEAVTSPIGFYAYLSQNEINPGKHHTIIFDVKNINIGNGYNSFSGMFTAPHDGLYTFAVSIIMAHEYASYEVVKNAVVQGSLYVDAEHSSEWRSSSVTIVTGLVQGDVVFVRTSSIYTPYGSIISTNRGRSSFAENISLVRRQDTQNSHVAFYAYLSGDIQHPGKLHTLIFDVIKTNIKDAYNVFSGIFTVPIDGLYVFTCSIAMDGRGQYASYEIMKNSGIEGTFFVDAGFDTGFIYSSLTIVIQAQKSDVIFVRIGSSYTPLGNVYSRSHAISSFAGWKIN